MKRRTARRRTLAYLNGTESDESDDSDDSDTPAQLPPSSIQDLVNPADAEEFDQTFTDADAALDIEGDFDPVAGDKQVIPRIAYVLNFNLVYNESEERWEPDTGNESGGGALQSTTLEKTTDQTLPGNNNPQKLTFQQTATDSLGAADLGNNQVSVPTSGEYLITGTVTFINFDTGADLDHRIRVNSTVATASNATATQTSRSTGLSRTATKVIALNAGDAVTHTAAANNTNNATVLGKADNNHLSVVQLS